MSARSIPTGYLDAYGNVWAYARGERRMLAPGESYYATNGSLCSVTGGCVLADGYGCDCEQCITDRCEARDEARNS